MKRKDYQEPMTNVVKLQHTQMLMTSVANASRDSYGEANTGVSDEEKEGGIWKWY